MQFHMLDRDVAVDYGPVEANLLYWFGLVLAGQGGREELYTSGGCTWVRLSLRQLQAEFSYYSPYVLRTALLQLEDYRLLQRDSSDLTESGRRKKYVGYSLTAKGQELVDLHCSPLRGRAADDCKCGTKTDQLLQNSRG